MAHAWLVRYGFEHEVVTDLDLHEEPGLLSRFAALLICGHSEYWTPEMRRGVSDYLAAGGNVISMSGDTLSVRVTWDADTAAIEARKVTRDDDGRWLTRPWWGERWHAHDALPGGSWRLMGAPAWELIGAGFKGMLDDGLSASFVPYTVLLRDHPLLTSPERVPISADGTIGDRSLNGRGGASGYEFDASPHHSGLADAPVEGIETLATATPQANLEWLGDPRHGADLLFWKRPSGGQVLSFGSIAVSGCLPVDEGIATLTRNALALFGVARREGTA
jgi:hypothetical protein